MNTGTAALINDGRVDLAHLRAERRARLLDAMAADGLDVLVLGRAASVTYATGARQLWTAGARPFGPACVVVGVTGRAHVLSVDDEGMPPEVSADDLFGLSWNPANLVASLAAIPGLAEAKRVGTESLSPGFPRLIQAVAPNAEVVDGTGAMWAARATKTTSEVACIEIACALAESALSAMVDALRPGVTERQLLAAHLERLASLGTPTPPSDGVACVTSDGGLRRIATDRAVADGELVALDAGAMYAGYEGGVARTWVAGRAPASAARRDLAARCRAALDATIDACRDGATGADVRKAWTASGEPVPPVPLLHGSGLGAEPPVVTGDRFGDDAVLRAGSVVSVTGWVAGDGAGGFLERETVLVTDGAPRRLSRFGHGPAGEG